MEQDLWELHGRTKLPPSVISAAHAIKDAVNRRKSHLRRPFLAALDGGSGAGKTTLTLLAAKLLGAAVVHYDDFYDASISDAEWDRCSAEQKCRRCMDWKRARREALLPLLDGKPASYRPFSFETEDRMALLPVTVKPAEVILLDGIYTNRPELADLIDLSILVQVPPDLRHRRHNERERSEDLEWHARWDPAETFYFTFIRPPSSYDLVLDA